MAQTQMFSYISVFMYEADNPLDSKRRPGNRSDIAGRTTLRRRSSLDHPAGGDRRVEADLRGAVGRIRSADDLTDLLRAVGFQTPDELQDRQVDDSLVQA